MRLFRFSLLLLPLGFLHAQSDAPKPKLPIALTAPNHSMWRVTTKVKESTMGANPDAKLSTSVVNVRKEGKILQELISRDGLAIESYIVGPIRLSNLGKKDYVTQIPPNDWNYAHYEGVDFDRFRWVDISNFSGVEEYKGRKVFVFKISGDKKKLNSVQQGFFDYWKTHPGLRKPPFLSDSVAMLDVETQLPVFYSDNEVDETYEFLPPPGGALVIPENFKAELKRQVDYANAMSIPL